MEQEIQKRRPYRWIAILLALVLIMGSALWIWLFFFKPYVRTNDAQIDGFKVSVSADILARIIKLHVDEGDCVQIGDLICDLDDSILQAQKIEALGRITSFAATEILEQFHFEKLKNDFKRAEKGFIDGVISAQELDHAQKNFSMADSRWKVAQANLELAKRELGVIEAKLWHTKVYSPINGMIVKRWVYDGDVVEPGQALFSLYDLDDVWVVANLEETKIEHVRIGNPVNISIDAYPGRTFFGKVFVIQGTAASNFSLIPQDNATGNYTKVAQRIPIKISIEKPDENSIPLYLFPGMSAEIKIKVQE